MTYEHRRTELVNRLKQVIATDASAFRGMSRDECIKLYEGKIAECDRAISETERQKKDNKMDEETIPF